MNPLDDQNPVQVVVESSTTVATVGILVGGVSEYEMTVEKEADGTLGTML